MAEHAAKSGSRDPRMVQSLRAIASKCFLSILEEEAASIVALTNLNSDIWNPVRKAMFEQLRTYVNSSLGGSELGRETRQILFDMIASGLFPSKHNTNAYVQGNQFDDILQATGDDDDPSDLRETMQQIGIIGTAGRSCINACCTGAFIVETMLCVISNFELMELNLPKGLRKKIFSRKTIEPWVSLDWASVLLYYQQTLDGRGSEEKIALKKFALGKRNLRHKKTESFLRANPQTAPYVDFPKTFSGSEVSTVATTMTQLTNIFDPRKNRFEFLSDIQLTSECFKPNVETNRKVVAGEKATILPDNKLFSGIGRSCPNLNRLDLRDVPRLSPDCLLFLVFSDPFRYLHKYMYLKHGSEETPRKHDDCRYCPYCEDPAFDSGIRPGYELSEDQHIFALADVMYQFMESTEDHHRKASMLSNQVRISDAVKALSAELFELDRSSGHEDKWLRKSDKILFPEFGDRCSYRKKNPSKNNVISNDLCQSLTHLLLPISGPRSKTFKVVPLLLAAFPKLKSLGECLTIQGLTLAAYTGNGDFQKFSSSFEDLHLSLGDLPDMISYYPVDQIQRKVQHYWFDGDFLLGSELENSFLTWLDQQERLKGPKETPSRNSDFSDHLKSTKWDDQMEIVMQKFPSLTSLKLSIKPDVLSFSDYEPFFSRLGSLQLSHLHIYSSTWIDAHGLLTQVGRSLRTLVLKLSYPDPRRIRDIRAEEHDVSKVEFLDTISDLCPELEKLRWGVAGSGGKRPIPICLGGVASEELGNFQRTSPFKNLTEFLCSGDLTLDAVEFLWSSAPKLQTLRISGTVLLTTTATSAVPHEAIFNERRVRKVFGKAGAGAEDSSLRVLEIPMSFDSIESATLFLKSLPSSVETVRMLCVQICLPGLATEFFENLVPDVERRMRDFEKFCSSGFRAKVGWRWVKGGLLKILQPQDYFPMEDDLLPDLSEELGD